MNEEKVRGTLRQAQRPKVARVAEIFKVLSPLEGRLCRNWKKCHSGMVLAGIQFHLSFPGLTGESRKKEYWIARSVPGNDKDFVGRDPR